MEDKKNIVIKVKYPTAGNKPENAAHSPSVVTIWNIKRLLFAFLGLLFVVVGLVLFFIPDAPTTPPPPTPPVATVATVAPVSSVALAAPAAAPVAPVKPLEVTKAEKVVNIPVGPQLETNKNITRALLTFKVNDNEPVGEIVLPLKLSKKTPTSVYYFVGLNDMKGRTVYHEWLLDGELITRKKVNISDNTWRTSCRQLFIYSDKTHWVARLVDETGQMLNEMRVEVSYE
ncbi:MAG: DUF2914 domain-containing protein [Methylococcales bacterium]|nr:DUF2914 domain-containing protein [Methylococcales bacterium]